MIDNKVILSVMFFLIMRIWVGGMEMPLYAVCLAESVEDNELISVVEASSEEEALAHHFRKYVCISEMMKSFITDLSTEGFFYKYFSALEWDRFREEFSDTPSFIELIEQAHADWDEASKKYRYVPSSVVEKATSLLSDEICFAVANYLIEIDLDTWAGDAVVTKVEIETV